jgi:penicillin-binding protein 1B
MGQVTLRQALAHSLNVAAVKVAQMAGYANVVAIARQAGMNEDIQPTPAIALGAYQVTPLEIARAYTIFANGGELVQPAFMAEVRDSHGGVLYRQEPKTTRVLDPRIAFLMVDMLQEVMRSGTAAGVRARGFRLPAAGKTGTSHDGWFAGFTSELLCVVWVGFDDYTDLGLEGARSALPIWTEFMTEAARYKQFGNAKPFQPPPGVIQVSVDPQSGQLAGPACGTGFPSYFVEGTQPQTQCAVEDVVISSTSDGGVVEQSAPVQAKAVDAPAQSQPPLALPVLQLQPRP